MSWRHLLLAKRVPPNCSEGPESREDQRKAEIRGRASSRGESTYRRVIELVSLFAICSFVARYVPSCH